MADSVSWSKPPVSGGSDDRDQSERLIGMGRYAQIGQPGPTLGVFRSRFSQGKGSPPPDEEKKPQYQNWGLGGGALGVGRTTELHIGSEPLTPPEVLQPIRRQCRVDRGAGDRPMPEVSLNGPCVVTLVGGVAEYRRSSRCHRSPIGLALQGFCCHAPWK